LRKRTLIREQHRRSLSRKLIEVANQMRLIVVTALNRDFCPRGVALLHGAKHLLKSNNAAKEFWSESNFTQEPALQLATADSRIAGQLIDRDSSACLNNSGGEHHEPRALRGV